jgi:acyl-CoA carboxylase epsilon subunit
VSGHDPAPGEPAPPPLRLVRGDATPEEIAALVAVLSAASAAGDAAPTRPRSQWASRQRAVRQPLAPGRGAWRASAFPR